MTIKIFLSFILLYSASVHSGWTGDWYNNVRRVQAAKYKKAAKESVETSCTRKLKEYKQLSTKTPSSKYYKWKVKTWTNRCNKERLGQ